MTLKEQLKSMVQKTTQATALAAGLGAGITAAEARAETTSEPTPESTPIVQVVEAPEKTDVLQKVQEESSVPRTDIDDATNQATAETKKEFSFLSPVSLNQKSEWIKPDMAYPYEYLNIWTPEGKGFTYDDVIAAEKANTALENTPQPSIDPKTTPYTEYEQGIIEEAVNYLSKNVDVAGGKDGVRTRIYQVLEAAGNPHISYTKDDNSLTASLLGHGRSNYSPGSRGHIYINTISDFVPEVAHGYRHQNNLVGERGNFIGDGLKDILTFSSFGFTENAQAENYKKTGYMENDTHSVVEPVLSEYIVSAPMGRYGELKTMSEVAATIDMLRHQQKDSSAVYTWTSEGDEAVAQGKESLRNRILAPFAKHEKMMAELAQEAGKEPLLKGIVQGDEHRVASGDTSDKQGDSQKLSPTLVAAIHNNRSNG